MAEYKNGVNFRGNMSVEKNNVNSDVQTGRAIFVDEDKYEKDSVYKAKVDKCLAEGFHKVCESGGGGGESYLGIHTATVNITYDTSEIEGNISSFDTVYIDLVDTNDEYVPSVIAFTYGEYYIPVSELGELAQITVPVSDRYPTKLANLNFEGDGGGIRSTNITVISGEATQVDAYTVYVTGDCSLNIKVGYQD